MPLLSVEISLRTRLGPIGLRSPLWVPLITWTYVGIPTCEGRRGTTSRVTKLLLVSWAGSALRSAWVTLVVSPCSRHPGIFRELGARSAAAPFTHGTAPTAATGAAEAD